MLVTRKIQGYFYASISIRKKLVCFRVECNRQLNDFQNALLGIWNVIEPDIEKLISHFTIRFRNPPDDFAYISFRIFREDNSIDVNLKNEIELRIGKEIHTLDPIFEEFHNFMRPETVNERWDNNKHLSLHELSLFVVRTIKRGLFRGNEDMTGEHNIHFLCNMMGLFEYNRQKMDIFQI